MPAFVPSKKRKLIGEVSSDKERYDFNQKDSGSIAYWLSTLVFIPIDRIIAHLKQLTSSENLSDLEERLTTYLQHEEGRTVKRVTWKSSTERQPIYLLGRSKSSLLYRPQS